MSNDSVIVELQGGLGNQLFGWAAGYVLSKKLNCNLKLDISNLYQRGYQLNDFMLKSDLELISRKRGPVKKYLERFKPDVFRESGFRYDNRFEDLRDPQILKGYFQSWRYHAPYQEEIYSQIRELRLKSREYEELEQRYDVKNLTAIHVRRGDYKALEKYHGTIKANYYEDALDKLAELEGSRRPFIVFSDQPEEAKLVVPGAQIYIGSAELASPSENIVLMSQCNSLIGANSSFSLWAGLLMTHQQKIRIFPKPWFTEPNMDDVDLMPSSFIRLEQ